MDSSVRICLTLSAAFWVSAISAASAGATAGATVGATFSSVSVAFSLGASISVNANIKRAGLRRQWYKVPKESSTSGELSILPQGNQEPDQGDRRPRAEARPRR